MSGGAGAPVSGDATREGRRAADAMAPDMRGDYRGGGMSGVGGFRSMSCIGMSGNGRPGVVTLAACLLVAGCQTVQPLPEIAEPEIQKPAPTPAPPPQPRVSETENLVSYYTYLRKLPGNDVAREHDAARQAYGRARSDYNGVRLAMVVTLPNTPFYDEPRALDILDPIAKGGDARMAGLAWLLISHIQERRRLDATAHALQQKLDALKSLERSLIERKR